MCRRQCCVSRGVQAPARYCYFLCFCACEQFGDDDSASTADRARDVRIISRTGSFYLPSHHVPMGSIAEEEEASLPPSPRPAVVVAGPDGLEFEFDDDDADAVSPPSGPSASHAPLMGHVQHVQPLAQARMEGLRSGVVFQSEVDKIVQLPRLIRAWALWLIKQPLFDTVLFGVILLNCVVLGMDEPGVNPSSLRGQFVSTTSACEEKRSPLTLCRCQSLACLRSGTRGSTPLLVQLL